MNMATATQQYRAKNLREQRGAIKAKLEALGTKLKTENRAMSAEEQTAFEQLKTDFAAVSENIRKAEADIAALDGLLAADLGSSDPGVDPADPNAAPPEPMGNSRRAPGKQDRDGRPGGDGTQIAQRVADIRMARQAWARQQYGIPLTRNHIEACKRAGINPKSKSLEFRLGDPATRRERMQQRALTTTTTAGGYLIAEDYSYELEQKLVDFSNVRGICREIQTTDGSDLPWPTEDDTGNTGELLGINTEVAFADPTFGSVTFGAYKFSSKGVLVPQELMQDSAFDVESMVFGEIGARIGRIQGTYFTTGSGTSQPKGVETCASAGVTTASATAFTADELTRLAYSLDPAYRSAPGVGYMMKDDVVAYCLMLKDGEGRPLLREGYNSAPGVLTINNFPVYPNQKMTGLTSNAPVTATKHVLFGDYKKFVVRDAGVVRVKRLDERYAEKDQVGFIGFMRSDSNCINTAAIKYMLQA